MKPSLPIDVFDSLHELLHLFRARMRKAMETVHPELTFNEMRILMRTGRQPGITQRDLVEHSHADKAQMARLLAHLEERGWLTRSPSESDKRVRCLRLSAQGQQFFTQLRRLQESVAAELLRDSPPPSQAQLLALLRQACDSADAHSGCVG
ncbi:MAG: MarR family transcriptional regulator [Castellaniella sp.]|uniref:MarR family winged helix-turn-helix transcriptional regulator n=1 Tax=Castellaniella sp. TaxID=1955812 RepID=UPI003C7274EE